MTEIQQFLNLNQQVLFKGTYNVNNQNQTSPSITTLIVQVDKNPIGYNMLVDNFYNTQDNIISQNNLLLETITIASYIINTDTKNGEIQYTSFYLNNTTGQNSAITSKKFIIYNVNSASGIYKGVSNIILDALSDQRILYFIGNTN
jgi:hypothetical protein